MEKRHVYVLVARIKHTPCKELICVCTEPEDACTRAWLEAGSGRWPEHVVEIETVRFFDYDEDNRNIGGGHI